MADQLYPHDGGQVKPVCCGPAEAVVWLSAVAELALAGDPDAVRWLPVACGHYLQAVRHGPGGEARI